MKIGILHATMKVAPKVRNLLKIGRFKVSCATGAVKGLGIHVMSKKRRVYLVAGTFAVCFEITK